MDIPMGSGADTLSDAMSGEGHDHRGETVLRCRGLQAHHHGEVILAGLDLDIQLGEVVSLIVESEWAARLVPRVLIGLESSDGGEVELQGTRLSGLSERLKLQLRRNIGYLFHNSGLIHNLTVWYNVALPALYHTRFKDLQGVGEHVNVLIDRCQLTEWSNMRPAELDESLRKRVALARAWVMSPAFLVYEDPLMNIDTASGSELLDLSFGPTPPEWAGRDPRPADSAVLITSQGLHEGLFRYVDRMIVIKKGEVAFSGNPKQFDRRAKVHPRDLINTKEASDHEL